MKRVILPELLDDLPAADPRALASRRDIRLLNRLMGHRAILHESLLTGLAGRTPKRIVELGAGDGTLLLAIAQQLSARWPRVEVVLLDARPAVTDETRAGFAALGWPLQTVTADVFDWLAQPGEPADVILANLFLHHFADDQLARLLQLAASRTNLFAACEPSRAQMPLLFSRLLGFIGCNDVTRHDAVVSVRAGFAGRELSALWPSSPAWQLRERRAGLFSHGFVAARIKTDCRSSDA